MGMGKIKALKIRSIGFLLLIFCMLRFSAFQPKRLRQKLKVMSEILSVPASRNNFAKKIVSITPAVGQPVFGVV